MHRNHSNVGASQAPVVKVRSFAKERKEINDIINNRYFNGEKKCHSFYSHEEIKFYFENFNEAQHVWKNLNKDILPPSTLSVIEKFEKNNNKYFFSIDKVQWDVIKNNIQSAPLIVPSVLPHQQPSQAEEKEEEINPDEFDAIKEKTRQARHQVRAGSLAGCVGGFNPEDAVNALNYLYSQNCHKTFNNRFLFVQKKEAEAVFNSLCHAEFRTAEKWSRFDKSSVHKKKFEKKQQKYDYFFKLTKDQSDEVCQAAISDVKQKKKAVEQLLEQENLSAHLRKHVMSCLELIPQEIEEGPILIKQAYLFKTKMQKLPLSQNLRLALVALFTSLVVGILLTAASVTVVVPAAGAVALSGGYSLVGLFNHRRDKKQIEAAFAGKKRNQAANAVRSASPASAPS
ncbi:MAG: hypothetical protein K0R24_229 [Gammaproteobacteria bacterium]|jgi:hypothetical protein|nr:hypothetical protein [Gammaproteobacteria bacterium]